jgi:prepilin-type N-terminal cleavage/methylation domain-containing protein
VSARRPVQRRRGFTLLEILIVLGVILILTSLVLGVGSAVLKSAEGAQARAALLTMESAFLQWESDTGRPVTFNGVAELPSGVTDELFDVRDPGNPAAPNNAGNKALIGRARGAGVYAVNLLNQVEGIRSILAGLPAGLMRPEANASAYPPANVGGAGSLYLPSAKSSINAKDSSRSELVDPWGNRIAFVFPGREYRIGVDPGNPDSDGTVRTAIENVVPGFGVCVGRRICLVSAGPDGLFGVDGDAPVNLSAQARADFLRAAAADNIYSYELDPPN